MGMGIELYEISIEMRRHCLCGPSDILIIILLLVNIIRSTVWDSTIKPFCIIINESPILWIIHEGRFAINNWWSSIVLFSFDHCEMIDVSIIYREIYRSLSSSSSSERMTFFVLHDSNPNYSSDGEHENHNQSYDNPMRRKRCWWDAAQRISVIIIIINSSNDWWYFFSKEYKGCQYCWSSNHVPSH